MTVTDAERRARLVARHHLGRTASDVTTAVRDLVALHSSDPTSPHLSLWARVPGYATVDLDEALCQDRDLWRLHAMRRTLWVAGAVDAPMLEASSTRKVAAAERRRILGWLDDADEITNPEAFIDDLGRRILVALADGPRSTQELGDLVDGFGTRVTLGAGKWAQQAPIGPRILYLLAMQLDLVRGTPTGTFRSSQYAWARTDRWFDTVPDRLDVRDAQAALAGRWLLAFGPATTDDVHWWTGWTKGDTRRALGGLGAVAVTLEDGTEAWLHPDDPGGDPDPAGTVALLPSLDPTPMGWKGRDFYLDDGFVPELFDHSGNVGPTVWADGRIVGGWYVRDDGDVTVGAVPLADVGPDTTARIEAEVERLQGWLDVAINPRFPTPLETRLRVGEA